MSENVEVFDGPYVFEPDEGYEGEIKSITVDRDTVAVILHRGRAINSLGIRGCRSQSGESWHLAKSKGKEKFRLPIGIIDPETGDLRNVTVKASGNFMLMIDNPDFVATDEYILNKAKKMAENYARRASKSL